MDQHSGYRDFVWSVELHKFSLEIFGLWPNTIGKKEKRLMSDLRMSIIATVIIFFNIIPLLCALTRVWGDLILAIDNLQTTLPAVMTLVKLLSMRWKQTVLSSIVKMMAEDWFELKGAAERDVMMRQAWTARLIIICGYILIILAYVFVSALPFFGIPFRNLTNLTDGERPLPLQTYYFYDTDRSPNYELTFVAQALSMFLSAVIHVSVDSCLGLVVLHICGQLENFRRRLIDLVLCADFDRALRHNVETHMRLIRLADNIENMFGLMLLEVIFLFSVALCLFGSLLVTVFINDEVNSFSFSRTCYAVICTVVLLTHTFLYCGAGEILTQQSEAVYRAICDLDWYKLKSRYRKSIMLLMIRANEPFRITAGKILPLTMTTFCSILKSTAGYISFLLAKQT